MSPTDLPSSTLEFPHTTVLTAKRSEYSDYSYSSDSDSLSAGAVAGLVIGGIFVLFVLGVWAWACMFGSLKGCGKLCKRRRDKKEAKLRQQQFPMATQQAWYSGGQQYHPVAQVEMDAGGYGATPEMMGNVPGEKGTDFHRVEMMGDMPAGQYNSAPPSRKGRWF